MRFFFYGTLLAESAHPVARAVHARLVPLGAAQVAGRLYAIPDPLGWYPAMVSGDGTVRGALYAALPGFTAADLARLDAYEGADYQREERLVAGAAAQVYVWGANLPEGAIALPHGDFARFLHEGGRAAYAGP
jgi:gamma-glutamylcyclotransferase (GGCT)/AIG2-like uncharacterized protein YtfP